ncbi:MULTISPECIES: xanthine dehydrogenase family protein molybdopterin-binding subunit [Rhodobacterales]|uniref:Isoquinoline 1-oxidoreductase, beta subunit n=3 Tax=Rhodobacterales TaxID=204455 RepID=A0A1I7E856_9RHOB|nr:MULTISPECIES: xanthine dehydrogenase family protein molybdopterin-binding subunit [Rhodobacterales]MAM41226.1 xanthine dehydrogenase family protein molybdopterin-binding subunit [Erythrobacter sp.]APE46051.1 twin-arginine translocation pathway signal protein [Sulfitobacter alexandrii]AUC56488.1 twin-arginine translocation pathway signal protein [Sagittula sp. P11]MCR8550056.1 xanthine dehydrogenase family protein molybdopterin-binding subunit [Salipiger pentaromativorans]PJE35289.1 xanthine
MLDRIIAGAVPAVRAAPLSRRGFLKLSAGAAGGLMLGAALPVGRAAAEGAAEGLATPFVHIRPDNRVVVIVKHLDKGQGTATGLATLVAEELDADAAQVTTEFAPANTALYANTLMGVQGTGGSTAMANSWQQYREAGATARAMLVAAAAETWGVDPAVVTVAGGRVSAGNNSATFGDLAEAAARQTVPGEVTLKSPDQWVYIGKSFPRVDVTRKTEGSTGMFGMDARIEGMVHAVSLRSPRFGGTLATLDDSAARAMPGVIDVIRLPDRATVIAETTWAAIRARDALVAEWDFSAAENRGTEELRAEYAALLDREGTQFHAAEPTGREAAQVIEADYFFPYLAHAPMEPIDVTVRLDGTAATFWTGSQIQTLDQNIGAQVLGIAPEAVTINTLWGGGSFGRRAIYDSHYVAEAAMVAKAWLDAHGEARPIKLVWTREDDIRGGYYRPMHMHRVRAGLDAEGNIAFWQHRVVGQGIMLGTAFEPFAVKDGVDSSSVEGLGESSPYAIPGWTADVHHPRVGVPVLWWRSVGHTHTAYVVETMMDELAQAAGADPVEFRLRYLADPRARGVLEMAADKAGALPEGLTRGIAVHKSFGSYVAEVADVRMREDGKVKVVRVTCAVDCGVPINPSNIRAQIEGGLGYGLSAILREEITLTEGEVDQSNFYDYTPLRITDMPEVEVHILPSTQAPTGIGEPGTPPIGPAVANAVRRATGQAVRELPFSRHGLA